MFNNKSFITEIGKKIIFINKLSLITFRSSI